MKTVYALAICVSIAAVGYVESLTMPAVVTEANYAMFGVPSPHVIDVELMKSGEMIITYQRDKYHTGEFCAVAHPPGYECDYGVEPKKIWREIYVARDGKIVKDREEIAEIIPEKIEKTPERIVWPN